MVDAVARPAGSVQSVDRALDMLEALARGEKPIGVAELADLTGLPQGTVHRLLQSLQLRGYVRRDASRKYSLGTAAVGLADALSGPAERFAGGRTEGLVAGMQRVSRAFGAG